MGIRNIIAAAATLCLAVPAMDAAPQAHWLSSSYNFGAFNEEVGIVTTTFKVVNTGDEPLQILSARANCGCTTPSYPKAPIAPGDTAVVTVGFNPTGRIGRFEKYVMVDTNAPVGTSGADAVTRSRQQLRISGTVIGASNTIAGRYPAGGGDLRLRTSTAAFGRVGKGKLATVSLAGYNRSSDSVELAVENLPKYINATIRPRKVAPGEMFNVLLSLNSRDCPQWGIVTDSATLAGGKAGDAVKLSTVAIVTDDFSKMTDEQKAKAPVLLISCEAADFGVLGRGDGVVERTVTLSNKGHNMLEVRRIYCTDPWVSVGTGSLSIKPGESKDINVSVDADALKSDVLNSRIMVICNDPANPQQMFRAVGEVRK